MIAFHYMQEQGGYWCYTAFLMVAFSALRLAIFNLDERQTSSFIGFPTPANAITCLNVIAGCFATMFALQGNYLWAAYCIALAAVFDFLDGFVARLLHSVSPI